MNNKTLAALLSVIFLAMTCASAIYFETGQRPAEKINRVQLSVVLPSTFEPATYFMNYAMPSTTALATGTSSVCPSAGSGITCVEDANTFTAGNGIFSVTINKGSGVYSMALNDGRTMFSQAYTRLDEGAVSVSHTTGAAAPVVMSYGANQLTLYWKMRDSKVRVEHFLTIYKDRPEFLVQQRILALADIAVTDIELDRFVGFYNTLSNIYTVEATGEHDSGWGATFQRYEPWVSAYSSTEAVGIIFDDKTSLIDASLGRELVPHSIAGTMYKDSVITSNVYVLYSDSKYSAREFWLKKKGLAQYRHLTSWGLPPGAPITGPPDQTFNFNFVKPQKYATLASLSFNVSYVHYSAPANQLACSLNDNALFDRVAYNDTPIVSEFPYRWLNSGANTIECHADGNDVAIPEINLTIANMHGVGLLWEKYGEKGWMLPITLNGASANAYSVNVIIDYNALGLRPQFFDRSSFRLVNEGGFQIPMDVDNQYVKFSVDVPPCCAAPRTLYLLFSKTPSAAFFSEIRSVPAATITGFGQTAAYGITVDAGIARPLDSQVLNSRPPSKAEYLPRELSPGILTETATKFIFDPATAKAAAIKLLVWRKA